MSTGGDFGMGDDTTEAMRMVEVEEKFGELSQCEWESLKEVARLSQCASGTRGKGTL